MRAAAQFRGLSAAPDDILPHPQSANSSDQNDTEWPGEAMKAGWLGMDASSGVCRSRVQETRDGKWQRLERRRRE